MLLTLEISVISKALVASGPANQSGTRDTQGYFFGEMSSLTQTRLDAVLVTRNEQVKNVEFAAEDAAAGATSQRVDFYAY